MFFFLFCVILSWFLTICMAYPFSSYELIKSVYLRLKFFITFFSMIFGSSQCITVISLQDGHLWDQDQPCCLSQRGVCLIEGQGILTPLFFKLNLFAMYTCLFILYKTTQIGNIIVTEKWNYFLIVQSNVHFKQTFFKV